MVFLIFLVCFQRPRDVLYNLKHQNQYDRNQYFHDGLYAFVGEDKKNKRPPYKHEIEMLETETFNPNMKEIIMSE